jgi:cobalt transporter subunit CbtA
MPSTGIGFALLLVVVSELAGGIANWRQGAFWGLAGFAVFTLAPGLGLPPELPAMPAADLVSRQVWWIGTVLATAAGLALIAFRGTVGWSPWLVLRCWSCCRMSSARRSR